MEASVEAVDAVDPVEADGGGLNDPKGPRDGRVLVAFLKFNVQSTSISSPSLFPIMATVQVQGDTAP